MSSPPAEDPTTLIDDLEIGDRSFLTAAYWEEVCEQGLDGIYHAATEDVQAAVGDWSPICRLDREADRYVVHVEAGSLAVPRTDWTTLSLVPERSRPEQLPAQKYEAILDRQQEPLELSDAVPELDKPDAEVHRRQVPNFTGALVDGELLAESDTIERIDVPRERLIMRLAEALALHPVALAELEVLCELDERLAADGVRFLE